MALVLLGIAAAGVLLPFGGGAAVQAEGWHRTLGAKLANDLLERIVSTPFDDIGTRWNGYAESEGQVKDAADVTFTDPVYGNFSRSVSCDYVRVWPQQWFSPVCFVVVNVQVCYQDRPVAVIDRLISK
jgi:hypothetical protein